MFLCIFLALLLFVCIIGCWRGSTLLLNFQRLLVIKVDKKLIKKVDKKLINS